LSDLKEQLKDAPKYIKTALNEIERYLQGEWYDLGLLQRRYSRKRNER